MLELLGMLGGGVFRLVPFIVEFFKAKADQSHELEMSRLQLQIDQARAGQALDLAHAQAGIAINQGEMDAWKAAIEAQGKPSGVRWVDALSSSVRPILTYYWCVGLYGGSKVLMVVVAWMERAALSAYVPILITEFDRGVIGSILGFWFVDRALKAAGK
jgi:hypothetical protein